MTESVKQLVEELSKSITPYPLREKIAALVRIVREQEAEIEKLKRELLTLSPF